MGSLLVVLIAALVLFALVVALVLVFLALVLVAVLRMAALVAATVVLRLAMTWRAVRAVLLVRRASVARRAAGRGEHGPATRADQTDDEQHRKSRPQHSPASLSCGSRQHSPLHPVHLDRRQLRPLGVEMTLDRRIVVLVLVLH